MTRDLHTWMTTIAGIVALASTTSCRVGSDAPDAELNRPADGHRGNGNGGLSGAAAGAGSVSGSSSGSGPAAGGASAPRPSGESTPAATCSDKQSAFELIQERIFDRHSCSAAACHGTTATAGLSLERGKAYQALVGARSQTSDMQRVKAGAPDDSFLFLKLRAGTEPGSVSISGSPMPAGLPALSTDELSVVRAWIAAGAPEAGPVPPPRGSPASDNFVADVLCRDQGGSEPSEHATLAPPAPDKGVQFRMPMRPLDPGTEWEGCVATYYDVSSKIPNEYKTPDGSSFYVDSSVIQLAKGSHHMSATLPNVTVEQLSDEAFGAWTCSGGDKDGSACNAADAAACGEGLCVSAPAVTPGCLGYGPIGTENNPAGNGFVQALTAEVVTPPIPGVYREVPVRAVVFWDFHGFNLTKERLLAEGRINMTFAKERRLLEQRMTISGGLDGPNAVPPFKKHRLCNLWTVPQGTEILRMTSHTHTRGSNFRVWDPSDHLIYESQRYAEPAYVTFQPAIKLDAALDEDRQIKFCADFNNGINEDGTPNMALLSQVSKTPDYEIPIFIPEAVACSTGKWGEPCSAIFGDEQCDSSPGAGDGKCDANDIHYGLTTAGEMFYLAVDVVVPAGEAQGSDLSSSLVFADPLPNEVLR